jgi:hypothetical protein
MTGEADAVIISGFRSPFFSTRAVAVCHGTGSPCLSEPAAPFSGRRPYWHRSQPGHMSCPLGVHPSGVHPGRRIQAAIRALASPHPRAAPSSRGEIRSGNSRHGNLTWRDDAAQSAQIPNRKWVELPRRSRSAAVCGHAPAAAEDSPWFENAFQVSYTSDGGWNALRLSRGADDSRKRRWRNTGHG